MLEVLAKKPNGAEHRWARHVDQRAIPLATIEVENLPALLVKTRVALGLLDTLEHGGQHVRLHPAGRTLPAGLLGKEFRQTESLLDHAPLFGIEPHHPATQSGTCFFTRIRIE